MLFSRFNAFLFILTVLLAVTVVVGGNGGALSGVDELFEDTAVNLIVYVDVEGRIYTIRPDGLSDPRAISPEEGFYTWPAWSPDGTRLAFSGTTPGDNGPGPLRLYISRLADGGPRVIYTNEAGMGPILPGMPHYPIWSPDSTRLVYMASVSDGLTLFLDDISDNEDGVVVLRRSPLYASWSADSQYVMVHAGVDNVLVDADDGRIVVGLTRQGIGYRAPAWWPLDSNKVALLQSERGVRNLYVADVATGEMTLIDEIEENVAFLWSPNGKSLAVAKSTLRNGLISPRISMYSPDGVRQPINVEGNILAYFWSPDSTKLAYVVLTRYRGVLRVMALDITTGDRWPLIDFTPTPDQGIVFEFFDQFAHSHSPWSPDSRALVFAGRLDRAGASASLNRQAAPQIHVVEVDRDATVTSIAEGFLAFWSPR